MEQHTMLRGIRMMTGALAACAALATTGCTGDIPTDREVSDATVRVQSTGDGAQRLSEALAVAGLLPIYDCNETRSTWVQRVALDAEQYASCATTEAVAIDGRTDAVRMTFPETGCMTSAGSLSGAVTFRFAGDSSGMDMDVDFTALRVNGHAVDASVGAGTCGAERSFRVSVRGASEQHPEVRYAVDARVALRPGFLLFAGGTVTVDATASLQGAAGTDRVVLSGLEFEIGDYVPRRGALRIETAAGTVIDARVDADQPLVGTVNVRVDGSVEFPVPFIHGL